MKRYPPVIVVILLAMAFAVFAQDNNETATEATEPETVSPTGADSIDTAEENDETLADEPESMTPADQAYQRAMDHAQKNEIEEAIADYTEAIRLDPENLEYLVNRAEAYCDARMFDKAFEDSAKVLKSDPNNLRALILRGKMFELSGDAASALNEFNSAVEHNPTSSQALFERQNHFGRQGQYDKALADADRLTQLQPDSMTGYVSRAVTHVSSGEFDEGMKYSTAAISQDPDNWRAYNMRGASRLGNGDPTGAKEDFDKALELSPDNALLLTSRGIFYQQTGEYEKSLADLEKAAELEPLSYAFNATVADFLATCPDEHVRNAKKATEYAKEALRLAPNDPSVWTAYASTAAENGNFEEAVQWSERLMASSAITTPQKREIQERLKAYRAGKPYRNNVAARQQELEKLQEAIDAVANNKLDRAIALCSEVIQTDSKEALAYDVRGSAYAKQNKYDLAIADYTTEIAINPKDADAYAHRGHLFETTRQYSKARDDLLKTEDSDPKNEMQNNLAWFFATCPDDKVRDGGKAAEYIDRALDLRPDDEHSWDTCAAVFAENSDFEDAVDWEKAYLERTDITDASRRNGEKRLALYVEHKAFRDEPEGVSNSTTASTAPAQRRK